MQERHAKLLPELHAMLNILIKRYFSLKSLLLILLSALTVPAFAAEDNNKALNVCATAQMYNALEAIIPSAPIKINAHYTTASEIFTGLIHNKISCDVIISPDERLPISLIRLGKTSPASFIPFARAKLILWSENPRLFNGGKVDAIYNKRLKSIALPDPKLTPVGFAAKQVIDHKSFPISYLNNKTYYLDHEYQVYSLIKNGDVESGFITLPLIMDKRRMANGSYWEVPRSYYPDIMYYTLIIDDSPLIREAQTFTRYLRENDSAQDLLNSFGFGSLVFDENHTPAVKLPGWN